MQTAGPWCLSTDPPGCSTLLLPLPIRHLETIARLPAVSANGHKGAAFTLFKGVLGTLTPQENLAVEAKNLHFPTLFSQPKYSKLTRGALFISSGAAMSIYAGIYVYIHMYVRTYIHTYSSKNEIETVQDLAAIRGKRNFSHCSKRVGTGGCQRLLGALLGHRG